jgi:peroxiredoxin
MYKPLLILLLGGFFVTSGCSAKNEVDENTKVVKEEASKVKKEVLEKVNTQPQRDRSDEIKAPNFKLATIEGEEFYLSDFDGKVVMLNFWGTWCPPCRKEIPDLINLHKKYNKEGLEIVGITLSSGSASDIKKFVDEKSINYTVLTDIGNSETQQVTLEYSQAIGQQISSIPTTLVIDREGYIVKGYLGPRSEEVFYNDLKEYL